ncbi:uncharacterized protein DUF3309 [Burkholderia sp. JKS000303]|nr:uncharacterized protein DUF3309 [Burkholderia sp. JKS000303]
MLGTSLIIILILMLIGAFPSWPHSRSRGYWPSSAVGMIVILVVIRVSPGRIQAGRRVPSNGHAPVSRPTRSSGGSKPSSVYSATDTVDFPAGPCTTTARTAPARSNFSRVPTVA